MRLTILCLLLASVCAGSALADGISLDRARPEKPLGPPVDFDNPRVTGDTIEDPFLIAEIPFTASGNTCNFSNDYDEICPYSGSTAPDVVFAFACENDRALRIDLCASTYDTKVYVYENDEFTLVACNDDACEYQSLIPSVVLDGGNTYYIVVDGYGSSCGDYALDVFDYIGCIIECPPGSIPEGEPECYENYDDQYNSGCGGTPPVFSVLEPSCDPIVICGTTGVFQFDGYDYRDTDWYEINLDEMATICLSSNTEILGLMGFIDGRGGCEGATALDPYALIEPCYGYFDLCHECGAGTWWIWWAPGDWDPSFACGSVYWLEVTGYTGGSSPSEESTWGRLKGLFR